MTVISCPSIEKCCKEAVPALTNRSRCVLPARKRNFDNPAFETHGLLSVRIVQSKSILPLTMLLSAQGRQSDWFVPPIVDKYRAEIDFMDLRGWTVYYNGTHKSSNLLARVMTLIPGCSVQIGFELIGETFSWSNWTLAYRRYSIHPRCILHSEAMEVHGSSFYWIGDLVVNCDFYHISPVGFKEGSRKLNIDQKYVFTVAIGREWLSLKCPIDLDGLARMRSISIWVRVPAVPASPPRCLPIHLLSSYRSTLPSLTLCLSLPRYSIICKKLGASRAYPSYGFPAMQGAGLSLENHSVPTTDLG